MDVETNSNLNPWGQSLGPEVPGWKPPARPVRQRFQGRHCHLEPLDPSRHAAPLFRAYRRDPDDRLWTYLPYGPFPTAEAYAAWMGTVAGLDDPQLYAIVNPASGEPLGVAGYLRVDPNNGSIEVGHLAYSAALRRSAAATEAMYLFMRHAFELGYRRYEWKCHSMNEPSRAAALRLGFQFEGLFRNATVVKGRSRDTSWFSIIDTEWPQLRERFETWLAPTNFHPDGSQKKPLASCGNH